MHKFLDKQAKYHNLEKAITTAINKNSIENYSNTPDHILADYMVECLRAFEGAVGHREMSNRSKDANPETVG